MKFPLIIHEVQPGVEDGEGLFAVVYTRIHPRKEFIDLLKQARQNEIVVSLEDGA